MSILATDRHLADLDDEPLYRYSFDWEPEVQTDTPDLIGLFKRLEQQVAEHEGYDLAETRLVERDEDLYRRVISRMAHEGKTIPAEDVLGDLGDEG
jgi:hypothetical protein